MYNVIVTCHCAEDLERLRLFVNSGEDYAMARTYNRAEWSRGNRPHWAGIVGCKTEKKVFELKLKFPTLTNHDLTI